MGKIFIAALREETPKLKDFYYSGVGKINATIKKLHGKYNKMLIFHRKIRHF